MRTIRLEEEAEQQLARLRVDYRRLDEAFIQIEVALRSKPWIFPQVDGGLVRRAKLNPYPGLPPLSFFFIYDADYVYLLAAEIIDSEE
jgi:hypothetical protein